MLARHITHGVSMVRIRSRWNARGKARSLEENAGALAFIEWRIAQTTLLNLENEGFQTDTQAQRLDVLEELCAFLIHVTDRLVHGQMDDQERERFIVALALKTADTYHDNRVDAEDLGRHTCNCFQRSLLAQPLATGDDCYRAQVVQVHASGRRQS